MSKQGNEIKSEEYEQTTRKGKGNANVNVNAERLFIGVAVVERECDDL